MKYQNYSNVQLLRILKNPEEHTSMEVYLAREEFSSRKISDEELDELKEQLEILIRKEKNSEQSKKESPVEPNEKSEQATTFAPKQSVYTNTKAVITHWLTEINPFDKNKQKEKKYLSLIYCGALIDGICFFISFLCGLKGLFYSFYSTPFIFSIIVFISLAFVFLYFYSAHLIFYKRRRSGWLLLFILLMLGIVAFLTIILLSVFGVLLLVTFAPQFAQMLSSYSVSVSFVLFVIYEIILSVLNVYLLILLFKKKVRKVFHVTRKTFYPIIISVIFILTVYFIVVLIKMIKNY